MQIAPKQNLNVKLLGSGLISRSKKGNLNITYVSLYVIVGILDGMFSKNKESRGFIGSYLA